MDINTLTAVKIKETRLQSGLSSQYVSENLGIALSNYSALENGKVQITIKLLSPKRR